MAKHGAGEVGNEKETEPVWRAEKTPMNQGRQSKVEAGGQSGKAAEMATQATRVSWESGTDGGTPGRNKHCPAREGKARQVEKSLSRTNTCQVHFHQAMTFFICSFKPWE